MISDFDNKKFPELKCEDKMFEKDEPFKPFQVLLMILPSSSKKLIPQCYHSIFTDLKEFYPEKFSLDFNGKRNPWEAFVILPFIKSKKVIEAEQIIYNKCIKNEDEKFRLSESDLERNKKGKSYLYYHDPNSNYNSSISKFKNFDFIGNVKVKKDEYKMYIDIKTNLDKNYEQKIVAYNFPTLKYIDYDFKLDRRREKYQRVEIFKIKPILNYQNLNEKAYELFLQGIMKKEDTVYFDCPFRREGFLQAIISPLGYYYLEKNNKVEIDKNYRADKVRMTPMKGFWFDTTNYLCEVFPLKCVSRNSDGKLVKIYEVFPLYVPLEVTSFNSVRPDEFKLLTNDYKTFSNKFATIHNEFPLNKRVLLLNKANYGQIGTVQAYINKNNHNNYNSFNEKNYNKLNYDETVNYDLTQEDYFVPLEKLYNGPLVEVKINNTSKNILDLESDSQFAKLILYENESSYISLDELSKSLNISPEVLKYITSSLLITNASSEMINLEKSEIVQYDIGLNLINDNLILPGYTAVKYIDKSEFGMKVEYSQEALKLIEHYMENFGFVFDSIKRYKEIYKNSKKFFKVYMIINICR